MKIHEVVAQAKEKTQDIPGRWVVSFERVRWIPERSKNNTFCPIESAYDSHERVFYRDSARKLHLSDEQAQRIIVAADNCVSKLKSRWPHCKDIGLGEDCTLDELIAIRRQMFDTFDLDVIAL